MPSKKFKSIFLKLFLPILLVIALAIPGIKDLTLPGYFSSHDGVGHLIRMDEFYQAFQDGQFPVRWSKRLYSGYGYPFFNFNYPSVYYFGVPIMMAGFSATTAMKAELAFTFILSGIIMFVYLRRHVPFPFALLGSVLYMYAPYRLLNIYVKGSVAESAAFIFTPLILWGVEAITQKKKYTILLTSLVIFALGISHNISALILFAFFFGYSFLQSIYKKSLWPTIHASISFVLGLMMASFFLVPALTEKSITFLDQTIARDYPDHFVYAVQLIQSGWGFGGSVKGHNDGLSFNLGWVHLGLTIVAGITVFILKKKNKHSFPLPFLFSWIALFAALFFMFPISKPLWDRIPLLPFVQFPWRFLMITVSSLSILSSFGLYYISKKMNWKPFVTWLVVIISIVFVFAIAKDEWHVNQVVFEEKFTGDAIEGTTTWADEQATQWLVPKPQGLPVQKVESRAPKTKIHVTSWKTQEHQYSAYAPQATTLVEHTMYYPGWRVWVNGTEVDVNYKDTTNSGMLVFPIPKGQNLIVSKMTETPQRMAVDVLSAATFLGVLLALFWQMRKG